MSAPKKEFNEEDFLRWYQNWAAQLGLDPNPDNPRHYYNYRSAYMAGAEPTQNSNWHWPSEFKADEHPDRFIYDNNQVLDTKYGKYVHPALVQITDEQKMNLYGQAHPDYRRSERPSESKANALFGEMTTTATPSTGDAMRRYGEIMERVNSFMQPSMADESTMALNLLKKQGK